ncbi:DNA-processing protein DprA [Klebsiella pneumoniae]|uniref:DNA-processing protein DprA n=1 Tax=Klebsiella pneumoniae TaxID=573 RepID=UPI0029D48EB5|nr:DNA-processing protein DprA [Klebsiella pneumoniae]MDX7467347.1 DNA-processing protein DprA [Klebsiella pneumoniae]
MTPDEIWLRLMKVSSLYGDRMVEIAQRLCAAASVDREALHAVGMTAAQAKLFFRLDEHELDETRRWLGQPDHHLLRGDDPRYPLRLKAIADYPGALLVSGGLALLHSAQLAVIGSRSHSWYGARWGKLFSETLAHKGITITSGLALGIDGVAHRGALAALRSGSLVTVRCALEQGRDVFALPGPIGNPGSEGPHWLIKQGAVPVTSPEDIVEYWHNELAWLTDTSDSINICVDQPSVALPFPELLANVGDEVTPVDVVAERAGQSVPVTVAQLLELELAGWIAAVPGGYVRLRRASHVRRTHVFV